MPTPSPEQQLEAATMRRVSWRLMPFLLAAYLIAYIDRVNVGFAALQMNKAVGLDPKTYGLGAGIFFIGYFIFEVPSNLALHRFGARKWIARIMFTWGIISACTALVQGPEKINTDPYGAAWMVAIKLADPAAVKALMDAAAYKAFVESESK